MELEVDIPPTIVLSSNGPASEKAGSYLGQFEFDKTKNCWIQASSDQGTIQTINQYSFTKLMVMVGMSIIVLVRRRKAGWRGPTLFHLLDGKFLWNRRRSNLKHHHWRNGTKLWPNVTITLSGKPAEKVPEVQGRYKKQNMIWQGHHVYKQSNGLYLYVDWGWWLLGCWFRVGRH